MPTFLNRPLHCSQSRHGFWFGATTRPATELVTVGSASWIMRSHQTNVRNLAHRLSQALTTLALSSWTVRRLRIQIPLTLTKMRTRTSRVLTIWSSR
jgi:hypothetical protein